MSPCRPSSKESTTSLSFPNWDDTRVSPFLLRAPQTVTIIIAPSPPLLCSVQLSLSLYFLIEIGERASEIDPFAVLLRESSRRRRRGFHLFEAQGRKEGRREGGLKLRNAFADEIARVRHAAILPSFLPFFLSLPRRRSDWVPRVCSADLLFLLAPPTPPRHQRPSPPPFEFVLVIKIGRGGPFSACNAVRPSELKRI